MNYHLCYLIKCIVMDFKIDVIDNILQSCRPSGYRPRTENRDYTRRPSSQVFSPSPAITVRNSDFRKRIRGMREQDSKNNK